MHFIVIILDLKISSLKAEKECYRQELEELAQRELEPIDPSTGETAEEREVREQLEALEVKAMVEHRKQEIRRQREMERYRRQIMDDWFKYVFWGDFVNRPSKHVLS